MTEKETKLIEAIEIVCQALREDKNYYNLWQSNITLSFKDEFWNNVSVENVISSNIYECQISKDALHQIANGAADNFLKLLTNEIN